MDRRQFIFHGISLGGGLLTGCRANQFAKVRKPGEGDMVGSHQAGAETFKPLVDQAVGELLARHAPQVVAAGTLPPPPLKICFVGIENKSAEEIGDFKEQIFQCIDTKIVQSQVFQPVNKRFVDAGLMETRLRPEQLFVAQNMRVFVAAMEQQSQPFDALLYATITSGTTRENKDYQRDYLLTLEMVDIHTGAYDKQAATLSKGYYHSRPAKWLSFTGLKN
jgi:hypothetical protein